MHDHISPGFIVAGSLGIYDVVGFRAVCCELVSVLKCAKT